MDHQYSRTILNKYQGVTNIATKEDFYKVTTQVLDAFIAQLVNVCGPYARYAMLLYLHTTDGAMSASGSALDSRTFLKDGRYILQNSEYIAPIEQYLKSMILYIGTRIDSICHDGTTTSMIFACLLLKKILIKQEELECSGDITFSMETTVHLEKTYKKLFDSIKSVMHDKYCVTIDKFIEHGCTKQQAATIFSYIQAQTSSGGDYEIAKAISTFFGTMPECAWDDAIQSRIPASENRDTRIVAITSEWEVELNTQFMTFNYNNYDNKQYYKQDSIDLLVMPPLPDSSFETETLYQFLAERKEPILLLIPAFGLGNSVLDTILEYGHTNNTEIALSVYQYPTNTKSPIMWNIDTINAKANKPKFDDITKRIEDCIVPNVSVLIDRQSTKINNITPVDNRVTDANIHPGIEYPDDYEWYTKYKTLVQKYLNKFTESHTKDESELQNLKRALSMLSVRHPTIIKLGGLSHEMQALIPVIEDAAGASMSSVKHGFYLNGIFKLYNSIITITPENAVEKHILDVLAEAAFETSLCIYGPSLQHMPDIFIDQIKQDLSKLTTATEYIDITIHDNNESLYGPNKLQNIFSYADYLMEHDNDGSGFKETPPMQPSIFIDELFDRVRELIIKLTITNTIIVPGSAWLNK